MGFDGFIQWKEGETFEIEEKVGAEQDFLSFIIVPSKTTLPAPMKTHVRQKIVTFELISRLFSAIRIICGSSTCSELR